QYVEIAGSRYAHIVDSHTGLGLTNRCSATVIAPDCITADSVATALCVLGPAKAIEFIEPQPELAAMITSADPAVGSIESSRFKRFVAGESPSPER
ncbi:MAG TPA: FAD:protein FMN transferase, partial [Pirellulales bacterium]|nr:FAD:protein FMN transferase [Pirellulales bacterium]